MEHSSSRLYSGPLSEAAQRVLVALQAQSFHAARHNCSYGHSQLGSQGAPWTQSRSISQVERGDKNTDRSQVSFSTSPHEPSNHIQSFQTLAPYQCSQTQDSSLSSFSSSCLDSLPQRETSETEDCYQRSQMYSHRKYSEPPAYQSCQALSFPQHEVSETAVSFSHGDRPTLPFQIPKRLPDQATFWSMSTQKFDKDHNEILFPTVEKPNNPEEEPAFRHIFSFCPEVSFKINNDTSGTQKGMEWWNVPINDVENIAASDSPLKCKQSLSGHTEDATDAVEDLSSSKQSKSKTLNTGEMHLCSSGFVLSLDTRCDANSPRSMRHLDWQKGTEPIVNSQNMTEAAAHEMLNSEHEMEPGRNGAARVEMDAILPTMKRSTSEMKTVLHLATTEDTNLKSNLYFLKTSDCYNRGAMLGETKIKECSISACEIKESKHLSVSDKAVSAGTNSGDLSKMLTSVLREDHKDRTGITLVHCEPAKVDLVDTCPNNLERTTADRVDVIETGLKVNIESRAKADINIGTEDMMESEQPHCSVVQTKEKQCEYKEVSQLHGGDMGPKKSGRNGDESLMVAVHSEDKSASTEDSGRECCPTPMLSHKCRTRGSGFKAPCVHDNVQIANAYVRRGSSSLVARNFASGQNISSVEDMTPAEIKQNTNLKSSDLLTFQTASHYASLVPSFPLIRKHEVIQEKNVNHPQKICLIRHPPKWQSPLSSQEKTCKGDVSKWKTDMPQISIPAITPEPQNKASHSHESELVAGIHTEPYVPKQTQKRKSKMNPRDHKCALAPSKQTPSSLTCKLSRYKRAKFGPDQVTKESQAFHKGLITGESQPQSAAGCRLATLMSDPRIKDSGRLNPDEKMQLLEKAGQSKTLVLTMVYQDGTTQLDLEQKFTPPVCGLLVLMKNDLECSSPEDFLGPNDSLVYFKLEQTPVWAQQHTYESQKSFTRDLLLRVLSRSQLVVCYKAKDLLRTALQFYKQDLNWKQVAGCHIQDPQVSGWLLDPADPSSCYKDLLNKHCKILSKTPALCTKKASQIISGIASLYQLNKELCSKLQSQGLWELYSDVELNMIPVLAAMESHCIYVDKETLKRTSNLLGTKMKQLEQEAHQAAGQMFLVTSNCQLRTVLFEKLRLHELCENKKLPKTIKQQQSTSEATLLQLQDLHPLPKIILEYRQVHKIKSTFVDGILSCMMSKSYISTTWYQTSVVTGRISAKHPNFQALPRQPLQIIKKQSIQGQGEDVVTVHPRAVFIPQEGWTFLAADFCQVELRLLAHLSSDPELLRIFTNNPQADVFTMLASQWKGIKLEQVTSEDREHAKRIVYSVVYGAGCKRLSGILGVSAEQASQFQDSFLQTYREIQAFIQRTIQQCHKQGYVLSIMGRRRTLPNISSSNWAMRMQAERQAVNFVVQGSAADLCKMAMIRIFNLVSSSGMLCARLIAQLHDELLYEVEDSQVTHFGALVKSTMESLQHIHQFGVHLKVPLKVAVSTGKSWGSMSELSIPSASPTPCL